MTATNIDQVRALAGDYLRRTGMTAADLAHRVGYAYPTIHQFLTGRYGRAVQNQEALAATVLRYLETHPISRAGEFSGHLYEIGNVKAMRQVFTALIERPRIYMVYAPPGSGKTDVARGLIREHNAQAANTGWPYIFRVYCRSGITRRDLMRRVATACGSSGDPSSIDRTIATLRADFQEMRVAIYLDEAQHLSVDCFETVRELYDELQWSLCFAGSHELERTFTEWTRGGKLEQLDRRVTDKVTLPAVTEEEAAGIVLSEIPTLTPAQVRGVVQACTVEVRVDRRRERYISIGRLVASVREMQETIAAREDASPDNRSTTRLEAVK